MDRLAALKGMLAADPSNHFARYALAQELVKAGKRREAVTEFERILTENPDYQAAYYHLGKTLEQLGLAGEARSTYERGVEASFRTGNLHARSELEEAIRGLAA